MSIMRVAVIGAGAAGLVALRHLSAKPDIFQAVAYEQTSRVGGTWVYTDKVGKDEYGLPIHSSMYKNMLTNLPKEVMPFPDFPFPKDLHSFMTHQEVQTYLEDYAAHFDLYRLIKFSTAVESVRAVKSSSGGGTSWEVGVKDLKTGSTLEMQQFDAVMVCNGHYAVPLIPGLPGLDVFQGTVMHSHDYRQPEVFKDKTVVVLGAAASGIDIALDLVPWASKIYLCHRLQRKRSTLPEKIVEKEGIKEVTATGVILDTGEEVKTDVLLFCTGYRYSFPFLAGDCKLDIDDERVTPLWKHLIHARYPTLSVLGVPKTIVPFPLFDCQTQFVLASLTGSVVLPSTEQMLSEIQGDYDCRMSQGLPHRYAHQLTKLQWPYNDELADAVGVPRIPKVVMNLHNHLHDERALRVTTYKTKDYKVTGPETFEEVHVDGE